MRFRITRPMVFVLLTIAFGCVCVLVGEWILGFVMFFCAAILAAMV
ncbi:hypothetical protein SEA_LIBERTYBELL_32 [Streptomyces phage LibertyBell]|nr:hypothetical protein SEA_LIBERTYBELL_32 [Streptomyces phage LibertyBell]